MTKNKEDILNNFLEEQINIMPEYVKRLTKNNNHKFTHRNEYYQIIKYIDQFQEKESINRLIVMPGIRGVGKTTLLYQIYEYLFYTKNIPHHNILYFSTENLNYITDCNIVNLIEQYINNFHNTSISTLNKKIYLLIDEAQYDKNWAIAGKILYDKTPNIFMIFTGSSALNLEYNADTARRTCKQAIPPLTYAHHLKLKYGIEIDQTKKALKELLFNAKIEEAKKIEEKGTNTILKNQNYSGNDWYDYLLYGGFPAYYNEEDNNLIINKIEEMTNKVINTDMIQIKNFTLENQINANRILRYLSLQESADVSYNKISKYLKTSATNVENILKVLETTHLIFHCEAYGSSSRKSRKPWKYYFATSSIKHVLSKKTGHNYRNKEKSEGILLENMTASKLHEICEKSNGYYNLFYDSNKINVDFIIKEEFNNAIPIEVGRGKKDKKQITTAIDTYNADYGIIISNTSQKIEKKDNIIYIPSKTFAIL